MRLSARCGPRFRLPCRDRFVGEPDGEAAPLPQSRIIFRPIRDPVPRLGNMMTMFGAMLERHGRQLPVVNGASAYADRARAANLS